jgi:hypothetical protein
MMIVSWDAIALRVDGARVNALARERVAGQVDDINITFRAGSIRVAGRKKVAIMPVPFSAEVKSIQVEGKTLVVPVSGIPSILLPILRGIVAAKVPPGVSIHPPFTFVVQLERFIPPFIDVDIRAVRIVDGGLAIDAGAGGMALGFGTAG